LSLQLGKKIGTWKFAHCDENWKLTDLKVMVSYFKCPGNSKMPTTCNKLLQRYNLTCSCAETERGRLKEGEEPVIDNDDSAMVTTSDGHGSQQDLGHTPQEENRRSNST
jgi:hypothetical protein